MIANNSENESNIVKDEISLKELLLLLSEWWKYLVQKWILILVFAVIGGGLGIMYAWSKKPIYVATTTFVLEDGDGGASGLNGLGGLATMVGVDIGRGNGSIFQGDNILELYKSRSMIEKTLLSTMPQDGSHNLIIDYYIYFNKLREGWDYDPELKKITFPHEGDDFIRPKLTRLQDSILSDIANRINQSNLDVSKPNKKLSIIRANVSSTNELFSKVFNDAIVDNVNKFYIRTKTKKSKQSVDILQAKTDSVRNIMNRAINSAASVADATPNLNIVRSAQRVAPIQRSQFSAETNKAVLSQLLTNLELSKMALLKETPLIQVVDQPYMPLVIEKYSKKKWMMIGLFAGIAIIVLIYSIKLFIKRILT